MAIDLSEITIEHDAGSTIETPEWRTPGITSGSQVLAGTASASFWGGGASTAIERTSRYVQIIEVEKDITNLLLADEQFRESIERAREEMRAGGPYLNHEEVFGEN